MLDSSAVDRGLAPRSDQIKDYKEEFEDTKWVIRIRILKNRQCNDQKKKYKRTNNDL